MVGDSQSETLELVVSDESLSRNLRLGGLDNQFCEVAHVGSPLQIPIDVGPM